MSRRIYWVGNSAKAAIVDEILASTVGSITIFDFGCGDGGSWPEILSDNPRLRLVGYEPFVPSAASARSRLQGRNASILTAEEFGLAANVADVIVSFSVYEHVVDRLAYLRDAKRLLKPEGRFYLNYDDGHFRYISDLGDPNTWIPAAKSALLTLLSAPLAYLGRPQHFQRRVPASVADRDVVKAGFSVERVDYSNLLCLKSLAKTLSPEKSQEFARMWIDLEVRLNREFRTDAPAHYGDSVNLWGSMVSRTMVLRHE